MFKHRSSLIVALLGMGLISALYVRAADAPDKAAKPDAKEAKAVEPLAWPAGFTMKDAKDTGVRNELATLANNALTMNHFDNFIGNLVDEDRKRIGDYKDKKFTDLDGKINVIRKFWNDKYGKDFDVTAEKSLSGPFAAVIMGEVSDTRQAVANWPVDPKTGKPVEKSGEAIEAGAREANKPFGGEKNLDKGRDVALVRIMESHGLPGVTASMIHEGIDNWRFDIPNTRTGQQIHDALLMQLSHVADHSKDWPADANEGYRMVTHRVLCAIYGVNPADTGGDRATETSDEAKPSK